MTTPEPVFDYKVRRGITDTVRNLRWGVGQTVTSNDFTPEVLQHLIDSNAIVSVVKVEPND